jgi:hypothetical protein
MCGNKAKSIHGAKCCSSCFLNRAGNTTSFPGLILLLISSGTSVTLKIWALAIEIQMVIWDVTPYRLVHGYRRFGGTYRSHLLKNLHLPQKDLLPIPMTYLLMYVSYPVLCEPGSSVSTASGYGLDDRTIKVRFPAEPKVSSSILCVQTSSGAHPASCTKGTGGPFPGTKARPGRDADHSPLFSAEVQNE